MELVLNSYEILEWISIFIFVWFKLESCPPVNSLGFCALAVHCDFDYQCSNGQLCCPGSCNQQYCQSKKNQNITSF